MNEKLNFFYSKFGKRINYILFDLLRSVVILNVNAFVCSSINEKAKIKLTCI